MTAKEIEALPPEAFLDPELFVTEWDKLSPESDYAWEQYRTGLVAAHKYKQVVISIDGVWSANTPGSLQSYERIGYHSNTRHLLRGLLAGTAEVIVCRWVNGHLVKTIIKQPY